jgi:AraC family L-rhamnose operon regulatory protein RhaS
MNIQPVSRMQRECHPLDHCEPQARPLSNGRIVFHALTKGRYPGTRVPQDILSGLSSIGFWSADSTQHWGEAPHHNEGLEISFLETGTMGIAADRKQYNLRAGQFSITRPGQWHKLGTPNVGPGRLHWLILDVGAKSSQQTWHWPAWILLTGQDLEELKDKICSAKNCVWNATPAIARSFRELARTVVAWEQPRSVSRLVIHINQLFLAILDALAEPLGGKISDTTSRQRAVELFLKEIKNNPALSEEPWTITSMAERCGMGVTAFSKYCRDLVNAGPKEFLNQCRLERAAELLRTRTNLSITEIALTCGFNSSQYFATRFRQRFQASPGQFAAKLYKKARLAHRQPRAACADRK